MNQPPTPRRRQSLPGVPVDSTSNDNNARKKASSNTSTPPAPSPDVFRHKKSSTSLPPIPSKRNKDTQESRATLPSPPKPLGAPPTPNGDSQDNRPTLPTLPKQATKEPEPTPLPTSPPPASTPAPLPTSQQPAENAENMGTHIPFPEPSPNYPTEPERQPQAYSPEPEINLTEEQPSPIPSSNLTQNERQYQRVNNQNEDNFLTPPSSQRSKPPNRRKGKKQKKKINKGGQPLMVWTRRGIVTMLIILCGVGVKSIIMPPQFPSPDQVIQAVQEGLEISDFPADRGNAFVISFTEAYLSINPEEPGERQQQLTRYAPPEIISDMGTSVGNDEQKIRRGPFVSGVRYVSDEDAVYTMATQLTSGEWIYLDVPVFYNDESRAFAVSGIPAFVSMPRLSAVPPQSPEWDTDDETPPTLEKDLERFFEAWSDPQKADLERYAPEGDARVKAGITGVKLKNISDIEFSQPLDEEDPNSLRIVHVKATWSVLNNRDINSDIPDEEVNSFTTQYEMLIYPTPDLSAWYVQDIRGGVRSSDGSTGDEEGIIDEEEE